MADLLQNPNVVAHIKNLVDDSSVHRSELEQQLVIRYLEAINKAKHSGGQNNNKSQSIVNESKPPKAAQQKTEEYLDFDEDHTSGTGLKQEVIERKNQHKLNYLQNENERLKLLLEDSKKNMATNKSMIDMLAN